jgi:8-oxo-dGTP pyrophosphatase MutT (NUDIX family)
VTNRNLLQDFWWLASHVERGIRSGETSFEVTDPYKLLQMLDYWGRAEDREPWGVCTLLRRQHHVLVVHGSKGVVLPGGKPFKGETPKKAGLRELREETGISASDYMLVLDSFDPIVADNGVSTYLLIENPSLTRGTNGLWTLEEGFESDEGVAYWTDPKILVGKHARFPLYNREVLTKAGLL